MPFMFGIKPRQDSCVNEKNVILNRVSKENQTKLLSCERTIFENIEVF